MKRPSIGINWLMFDKTVGETRKLMNADVCSVEHWRHWNKHVTPRIGKLTFGTSKIAQNEFGTIIFQSFPFLMLSVFICHMIFATVPHLSPFRRLALGASKAEHPFKVVACETITWDASMYFFLFRGEHDIGSGLSSLVTFVKTYRYEISLKINCLNVKVSVDAGPVWLVVYLIESTSSFIHLG